MDAAPCKKRQTREYFLHESLLEEILVRLPVKSIFRFKSVSKQWLYLLSDPSFVHRKIATFSSSPPWTILLRYSNKYENPEHLEFKSIASQGLKSTGLPILSPYVDPKIDYEIASTCRKSGLVLLRELIRIPSIYHLCNPITSQWVTLPPAPKRKLWGGKNILTQVDDRGCLTSFRVVILNNPSLGTPTNEFDMDIFSSDTKEWKSIKVHCPQHLILGGDRNEAILSNGILHYVTGKDVDRPAILVYDPYTDSKDFRLIEYPKNGVVLQDLWCVSQGRLLYLCIDLDETSFKRWVLEDYDRGKWRLEFEVEFNIHHFLYPISLHPFNSDILYVWYNGRTRSFDMRTRRLGHVNTPASYTKDYIMYVFPLWPMSIPMLSADAIVHS